MHLGNIECRLEGIWIIVQNIAGRKLSTVYVNQMNLNGKLRKKLEGLIGEPGKNLGGHGPPRPPLRIATAGVREVCRCCRVCAELKPSFVKQSDASDGSYPRLGETLNWFHRPCERCKSLRTYYCWRILEVSICIRMSRSIYSYRHQSSFESACSVRLSSAYTQWQRFFLYVCSSETVFITSRNSYQSQHSLSSSRQFPVRVHQLDRVAYCQTNAPRQRLVRTGVGDRPFGNSAFRSVVVVYSYECRMLRHTNVFHSSIDAQCMGDLCRVGWSSQDLWCCRNKSEPPCEEVELLEANPTFASLIERSWAFRSRIYLHVHFLIHPLILPSKLLEIILRKVLSQNLEESRMWLLRPVVEPDGGSSGVDHESAGDNPVLPRRSTRFRKAPERYRSGSRSTCSGANVNFRKDNFCIFSFRISNSYWSFVCSELRSVSFVSLTRALVD